MHVMIVPNGRRMVEPGKSARLGVRPPVRIAKATKVIEKVDCIKGVALAPLADARRRWWIGRKSGNLTVCITGERSVGLEDPLSLLPASIDQQSELGSER